MATSIVVPGMSTFTPGLIADPTFSYPAGPNMPASGPGGVPTFTTINIGGTQTTVSAALEIQSTTGAFLMPRMTAAQRLLLIASNGMQVYETDTGAVWWYLNGSWTQVDPTGGGGGDISGPGASTLNALVSWNNVLGTQVKDNKAVIVTSVTDANASDLTLIATIQASKGADTGGATPNYSFTGDAGTGMWSSGADVLDFSTNAVSQFRVDGVAVAVNRLLVSGSATGVLPANAALLKSTGSDAQVDIGLIAHGNTSGVSILPNDAAAVAPLRFWNAAGTFYTSLNAGVNAANLSLTLPIVDATSANQPLVSNGAGVLTFSAVDLDNVVVGPASATDNAITRFDGTTGKLIQNSAATMDDTTGTITLSANGQFIAGLGAVAAPAFTFLGDTNTGIYRASAEQIGFTANGELQFAVRDGAGTVVNTAFIQGAATGAKATIGINLGAGDANQDLALVGRGAAGFGVAIMPTAATAGTLKLYDLAGNNFTALKTIDAQVVDLTYVFPATGPTANQVLSNGADVSSPYQLTWVTNFVVNDSATPVNYLYETTADTGTNPTLGATGTDTNVGFDLLTKGTGDYSFATGNGTQLEILDTGSASTSWLSIIGSTGTPGIPTIAAQGAGADINVVIQTKGTAGLAVANSTFGGALALLNTAGTAACAITVDPAFVGQHIIQLPNITAPAGGPYLLQATRIDAQNTTLSYALNSLQFISGTLSSANVLGMFATPILLVPTAGANTVNVVQRVVFELAFNTTAYTTGGPILLQYGNTAGGLGTPATTTTPAASFNAGVSEVSGLGGTLAATALSNIVNQDIYISNQTAAFLLGDSPVNYYIFYTKITTT